MKIKTKPFVIVDNNKPFEEDALNREEYAKILLQFFSNTEESLTLAINSGWGTGKTTFVLMLQQLLENEGFPTILFNAWENDYSDDALTSLIGEVLSEIKKYKSKYHIMDEDINKFVEDGAKLLRAFPNFVKFISGGQLDYSIENLEKINQEMSNSFAKSRLSKYTENKKDVLHFKKHLQKFVQKITNIGTDNFKPLIFFIDELDRCRPNFTIELLEKLKHIFDIEGIIFVLSIDKEELEKTIKIIYGNIKIDGYLRKFIDFTYNLPIPPIEDFCKHLLKTYGFENHFKDKQSTDFENASDKITKTMIAFATEFNFSLRKIEQCFSQLSIVLKTTNKNSDFFPIFTIFLICLKNYDESIYIEYISKQMNKRDILRKLNEFGIIKEYLKTNYGKILEAYFILSLDDSQMQITDLIKKTDMGNASSREKEILYRIRRIVDNSIIVHSNNILQYISNKIEITDNFST